jgi:ParB-like chromosome segregation protein Spo0J
MKLLTDIEELNLTRPPCEISMTLHAMVKHIELWLIDKLIPFARNPRTHSEAQIAQIAASIAEFGFNNPILVDTKAGIIAGHGRLLAARKLGLKEVPVIVLDHLSEIQKRAYIIADNRLTESGGWDDEVLRQQLAELRDANFDLETVGFDDDDLRALLADTEQESTAPDEEEIPVAPTDPVTRPDDVWSIGRHRLICSDCRDARTLERLFGGTKANLVITSPPYATQREYDPVSGFQPVRPDDYSDW